MDQPDLPERERLRREGLRGIGERPHPGDAGDPPHRRPRTGLRRHPLDQPTRERSRPAVGKHSIAERRRDRIPGVRRLGPHDGRRLRVLLPRGRRRGRRRRRHARLLRSGHAGVRVPDHRFRDALLLVGRLRGGSRGAGAHRGSPEGPGLVREPSGRRRVGELHPGGHNNNNNNNNRRRRRLHHHRRPRGPRDPGRRRHRRREPLDPGRQPHRRGGVRGYC
mmetsp:Transcript_13929/g.32431  ORF Transcript_13929/g.32431 Transcript_13929/m.32431 type:complete len:221 (+) Transcript_13929:65-727(+)